MAKGVDIPVRGRGFPAGGVFEAALDAVVVMSADGIVRDWNPAAERVFGYTFADAVGRNLAALIIPAELRERHHAALARYTSSGEPTILDQRLELNAMRSDGVDFPAELTVTRVPDTEPPLFAGFVRDLTAQRQAEGQRQFLERRLEFLAEAALALDRSLDLHQTLDILVELVVPELATVGIVDMVGDDGKIEPGVATAAVDPERARLVRSSRKPYRPVSEDADPVARVLATGQSLLLGDVSDSPEATPADWKGHPVLQRLGCRSAIVVPLIARGRVLGALWLLRAPSDAYDGADRAFADELARRAALSIDNARLYEQTRHVAVTLQEHLLPASLPPLPGGRVVARYRAAGPAQHVGGDFYDCFQIREDLWGIAIGDVCGKGPEAAAMTALARFTMRAAAMADPHPAAVLRALNDAVLLDQGPAGRFLSAVYGTIETGGGALEVCLASAGHPRPLVAWHDGQVDALPTAGPLIGIDPEMELATTDVTLDPQDMLVLYTDGLTDAGAPDHILDEDALRKLLAECANEKASVMADRLENASRGLGEPRDDVAVLVVQSVGAAAREAGEPQLATLRPLS
jgi:PAS domain S-box-containing protein